MKWLDLREDSQPAWVQNLALPFISWVTLGNQTSILSVLYCLDL